MSCRVGSANEEKKKNMKCQLPVKFSRNFPESLHKEVIRDGNCKELNYSGFNSNSAI